MENSNNAFLAIKVLIAAVCGAFTAAFGWLGWLIVAWVACNPLIINNLSEYPSARFNFLFTR